VPIITPGGFERLCLHPTARRAASALSFHAYLTQDGHHRTPIGECRLEKVQAHESGKRVPPFIDEMPEQNGSKNKNPSNQPKPSI
jgi:hypothetical protein